MRFRFFETHKELSHDTLTRYCNLDYDREIAIVAELPASEKKIIGVVRLILTQRRKRRIRHPHRRCMARSWSRLQTHGHLIAIAKDMRVQKIYSCILTNNKKMLQLCRKKGFNIEILMKRQQKRPSLRLRVYLFGILQLLQHFFVAFGAPAHVAIMPSTKPSSFAAFSSTVSIVAATGQPIIFTVSTFLGVPTRKYA
jgi:hypothetical protein